MKQLIFIAFAALFVLSACTQKPNARVRCQGFTLTCQNGGTCGETDLGNGNYKDSCACPLGYHGLTCNSQDRDYFIGTWVGYNYYGTHDSIPDTIYMTAGVEARTVDFVDKTKWSSGGGTSLTILIESPNSFSGGYYHGRFVDGSNKNTIRISRDAGSGNSHFFIGDKM